MPSNQGSPRGPVKARYPACGCDSVKGNSTDVELFKDDCEVRADIVVERAKGVRIWGIVKDCNGYPVSYALVKLIKVVAGCSSFDVEGIAHTITDCNGFYQFEVTDLKPTGTYKILVNKASSGNERRVPDAGHDKCRCEQPCMPLEGMSGEY